ncbi:hypothetical protein [Aneurinibacillus migulanus]|uniref:hypothetical protein n=1 Tax=Aneurinibacillus migulanus TaxID=47500 RepID=UPI00209DE6A4|nr:hypothetical protein [Aneurinibacillus migulanus]MCP1359069.1 hypothetical protein [Aneurinibacillus migulanus]
MEKFQAFDPLETKYILNSEAANKAIKREINNILNSYVGWYDPFCELIQNALDSIEEREKNETADYTPTIWITISIKDMLPILRNHIYYILKKHFLNLINTLILKTTFIVDKAGKLHTNH